MLTMAPAPLARKCTKADFTVRKAPSRLTANTARQSARVIWSSAFSGRTAALLMRTSRPPKRSTAAAISRSTAAASPTSASTGSACPPAAAMSAATASTAWRSRRPLITTAAPAAASARAMARPMLRPPPVTRATRPSRSLPTVMLALASLLPPSKRTWWQDGGCRQDASARAWQREDDWACKPCLVDKVWGFDQGAQMHTRRAPRRSQFRPVAEALVAGLTLRWQESLPGDLRILANCAIARYASRVTDQWGPDGGQGLSQGLCLVRGRPIPWRISVIIPGPGDRPMLLRWSCGSAVKMLSKLRLVDLRPAIGADGASLAWVGCGDAAVFLPIGRAPANG